MATAGQQSADQGADAAGTADSRVSARKAPAPSALHNVHPNNFDLIRLFAALQVVYAHGSEHLRVPWGPIGRGVHQVLEALPGVPIFFVVSGFLISMSYERHPDLGSYARNRFLRIYPALWAAFLVGLALIATTGFLGPETLTSWKFPAWVAAQLTIFQFWNPDFLRSFGVGVLNGSLWTIPVELGFYAVLPLLYRGVLDRMPRSRGDLVLVMLALASYSLWFAAVAALGHHPDLRLKLLMVTIAPYLYMFLFGVLIQRHRHRLERLLVGKAWLWAGVYAACFGAAPRLLPRTPAGNFELQLLWQAALALLVVSFAFTRRRWSDRVLRGNDISYGVYLYHMLVVNLLVYLGWTGAVSPLLVTFAAGVLLAVLSWRVVEAPALRRKRAPLHRVRSATA